MSEAAQTINVIRMMAGAQKRPLGLDGVIVGGSYDPTVGTVSVMLGDSQAIFDPDDQPIVFEAVPLLVPAKGFQAGPRGGERCILIPRQGGTFGCLIDYDLDDSPNAPAGETWLIHYDANGTITSYTKWTNDGATMGDAKGGLFELVGSRWLLQTAGGLAVDASDGTGTLGLAAIASSLDSTQDAVVTQRYLQAGLEALRAQVQTALTALAARVQGGSGVSPPTVGDVTSQGSTKAKAAQ